MKLRLSDRITDLEKKNIDNNLLKYNLEHIEEKERKDLGIFFENAAGEMQAGLLAETRGKWLLISTLWVNDSLRGKGVGKDLLLKAEAVAKERGVCHVFLDTFDFQAPGFYTKMGYREVLTLHEYPVTGKRHYYIKDI